MAELSRIEALFLSTYVAPRPEGSFSLLSEQQWEFSLGRNPRAVHDELLKRQLIGLAEPMIRGAENYPTRRLQKGLRRRGLDESGTREEQLLRLATCDERPVDLTAVPRFVLTADGTTLLREYEDNPTTGQPAGKKVDLLAWFGGAVAGGIVENTADRLVVQGVGRLRRLLEEQDVVAPPFTGDEHDYAAIYGDVAATPIPPGVRHTDWTTRWHFWMQPRRVANEEIMTAVGGADLVNVGTRLRYQLTGMIVGAMVCKAEAIQTPWAGQTASLAHASVELFLSRILPDVELVAESEEEHRVKHELFDFTRMVWDDYFGPALANDQTVSPTDSKRGARLRSAREQFFMALVELAKSLPRLDAQTGSRVMHFLTQSLKNAYVAAFRLPSEE